MRIKMLTTVKPGLVFLIAKPGTVLSAGREYKSHGKPARRHLQPL